MPTTHPHSATASLRSNRATAMMTAMMIALFAGLATSALATPLPKADYHAAMTSLDAIETLVTQTITALHTGMSQADAIAALPHLQERLQWMRDTKVAAARIDTSHTLRAHNADSQRARCLIMRAGLMDETFQDVMVNVSMKARGVGDDALLPLDESTFNAVISRNSCHP